MHNSSVRNVAMEILKVQILMHVTGDNTGKVATMTKTIAM